MLQTLRHRPPPIILEAEVRPFFREQFQDVKIVVGGLLLVDSGLDRGHMRRGVPVLVRFVEIYLGFVSFLTSPISRCAPEKAACGR